MTDLGQLERRRAGLSAIREIVSSLRALSSLQFRRAREGLGARRELESDLHRALAAVSAPRPPVADPQRILLIVLGTDQGFCGPLVERLVEAARARMAGGPEGVSFRVLAVGSRTRALLERQLGEAPEHLPLPVSPRSVDPAVETLAEALERRVGADEVDGIDVVYAHFLGPGRYEPRVTRLFPVAPERLPRPGRPARLNERADRVLDRLVFEWIYAELYRVVLEALSAEHGARMNTTDAATRAADDALAELDVQRHRARQAEATHEVLEILAAAEAVSSE